MDSLDLIPSKEASESPSPRLTGLVGICVLVFGSFTHHVNSKLIVFEDPVSTATNILTNEMLFRSGFVSSILMEISGVMYALFLYKLLRPVNRDHAVLMVIFALIPAPLFILNQLNQMGVLYSAFDQLNDQMMFYLNLQKHGSAIAAIFFGIWLFPLGLLVFHSKFLPKIIGVLLIVGSPGYVIHFFQVFLFPGSEGTLWSNPVLIVTHISEISLLLWLLVRGVNEAVWTSTITKSMRRLSIGASGEV